MVKLKKYKKLHITLTVTDIRKLLTWYMPGNNHFKTFLWYPISKMVVYHKHFSNRKCCADNGFYQLSPETQINFQEPLKKKIPEHGNSYQNFRIIFTI